MPDLDGNDVLSLEERQQLTALGEKVLERCGDEERSQVSISLGLEHKNKRYVLVLMSIDGLSQQVPTNTLAESAAN